MGPLVRFPRPVKARQFLRVPEVMVIIIWSGFILWMRLAIGTMRGTNESLRPSCG